MTLDDGDHLLREARLVLAHDLDGEIERVLNRGEFRFDMRAGLTRALRAPEPSSALNS